MGKISKNRAEGSKAKVLKNGVVHIKEVKEELSRLIRNLRAVDSDIVKLQGTKGLDKEFSSFISSKKIDELRQKLNLLKNKAEMSRGLESKVPRTTDHDVYDGHILAQGDLVILLGTYLPPIGEWGCKRIGEKIKEIEIKNDKNKTENTVKLSAKDLVDTEKELSRLIQHLEEVGNAIFNLLCARGVDKEFFSFLNDREYSLRYSLHLLKSKAERSQRIIDCEVQELLARIYFTIDI